MTSKTIRAVHETHCGLCISPYFTLMSGLVVEFLVVLIGLVLIFKKQLTNLVNDIFKTITTESKKV